MKLLQLPVKILLVLVWSLFASDAVRSQSGNMSDITLPNPESVVTDPTQEEITDVQGDGDQGNNQTTEEPVAEESTAPVEESPVDVVIEENTTPETSTEDVTAEEPATSTDSEEVTSVEADAPVDGEEVVEADASVDGEEVVEADALVDGERAVTDETPVEAIVGETSALDSSAPEEVTTSDIDVTSEEVNLDSTEATTDQPDVVSDDNVDTTPESVDSDPASDIETDGADTLESQTNQSESEVVETEQATVNNSETDESPIESEITSEEVEENTGTLDNQEAIAEEDTASITEEKTETIAEEDTASIVEEENGTTAEEAVEESDTIATEEEAVEENDTIAAEEEAAAEEAEALAEEEAAAEEAEEEAEAVAEEEAEEQSTEAAVGQLDRVAYEAQFQEAAPDVAIQMQEEFQLNELIGSSGLEIYGNVPSVKDISARLSELAEQTGKRPAFINVSLQSNQLESFVVLPDGSTTAAAESATVASTDLNGINSSGIENLTVRKTVKDTSRKDLIATAGQFREEVSNARNIKKTDYLQSSQELYKVLIEPISAELEANDIDILVFSLDSGLRLLPLAALHDGEQFLVEKYAMATVPSFGLTDTRYVNLKDSPILAMGASEFTEQNSLPAMPLELETILRNPRQGEAFLNEQFTISNFRAQNSREKPFPIIHLGTHAEFKAGNVGDSYIQFYDDKLKIPQLQELSNELGWNSDATPVELLVLSACVTAFGDAEAELGFAGLAVQAGAKSALASLWYVSDLGTLALMGEFYDQLGDTLVKAEALRQTQLQMLKGNVMIDDGAVSLSNGENLNLPAEFPGGTLSLNHPYFWSSFTLIGNWN